MGLLTFDDDRATRPSADKFEYRAASPGPGALAPTMERGEKLILRRLLPIPTGLPHEERV